MPFALEDVVPWGRSLREYRGMFSLSAGDLDREILACADGPASFNAEATQAGSRVTSCDPLYAFSRSAIRRRVEATHARVLEQARRNRSQFVWEEFASVEELGRDRLASMNAFLDDFENGLGEGRYVAAALPRLPFDDGAFDLALCSHFLFLYSEQLGEDFHVDSIREMCRVAREVRVYPLVALDGKPSAHAGAVTRRLRDGRLRVTTERVPYEFQRGADHMMRVRSYEA